jgi:hypothetical protein
MQLYTLQPPRLRLRLTRCQSKRREKVHIRVMYFQPKSSVHIEEWEVIGLHNQGLLPRGLTNICLHCKTNYTRNKLSPLFISILNSN